MPMISFEYKLEKNSKIVGSRREIVVQCRPCAVLTPGPFYAIMQAVKEGRKHQAKPPGAFLLPIVWKEFQKILAGAGIEHHRVHDLRHTFAVNSIRAGDDIKTLQENMGHYSAAFTLDRYGHVTETIQARILAL